MPKKILTQLSLVSSAAVPSLSEKPSPQDVTHPSQELVAALNPKVKLGRKRPTTFCPTFSDVDSDMKPLNWCNNKQYAFVTRRINGKVKLIYAHRLIGERIAMRQLTPLDHIDHINHDTLDNRRENIRVTNSHGNMRNQHKRLGGKSRFIGVCYPSPSLLRSTPNLKKKWRAIIKMDGKIRHLGYFATEIEAAKAYNAAASALGFLTHNELSPFRGRISDQDTALRAALDESLGKQPAPAAAVHDEELESIPF